MFEVGLFLKLHGLSPDQYLGVNRMLATTTASDFSARGRSI